MVVLTRADTWNLSSPEVHSDTSDDAFGSNFSRQESATPFRNHTATDALRDFYPSSPLSRYSTASTSSALADRSESPDSSDNTPPPPSDIYKLSTPQPGNVGPTTPPNSPTIIEIRDKNVRPTAAVWVYIDRGEPPFRHDGVLIGDAFEPSADSFFLLSTEFPQYGYSVYDPIRLEFVEIPTNSRLIFRPECPMILRRTSFKYDDCPGLEELLGDNFLIRN